jgi:hypothetical protein
MCHASREKKKYAESCQVVNLSLVNANLLSSLSLKNLEEVDVGHTDSVDYRLKCMSFTSNSLC